MFLIVGSAMIAIIVLTAVIRGINFRNTPEAKAFLIANAIALRISELSAAEEGSVVMEFEEPYNVGFATNAGIIAWFKGKASVVVPDFIEESIGIDKLSKLEPQGVYVVVSPAEKKTVDETAQDGVGEKKTPNPATFPVAGKKAKTAQFAYVAAYSFSAGTLKEPKLGEVDALCIQKKKGENMAEVNVC